MRHGSLPALAYRCTTPDRTIVLSDDAAPMPALVQHYADCDILIHEAYSAATFAACPPDWPRYHADVHTSATELAAIANVVRPQLLILARQLRWGVREADLLAEIAAHYDGPVVSGRVWMWFE